MSAFLGYIHFWLYGKIRRVVEREELLFQKAASVCGPVVEELRAKVWGTYGEPLPDTDLAELIDQTNIHGWLQRQVNAAELREAAFIKELTDTCGAAAKAVIAEVFAGHGRMCGGHARLLGKYAVGRADGIYKALNDYYLNGMPCDQAANVTINTPERVVWEGSNCPKQRNWARVGIDAREMRDYYVLWLAGFVEGINPAFNYALVADTFAGDPVNKHQIAAA
ncbi:MAG: hypothetical protein N2491_02975 [Negativicutes bacterium]|nr:hypothetical protein [Negativicutes bacterium]